MRYCYFHKYCCYSSTSFVYSSVRGDWILWAAATAASVLKKLWSFQSFVQLGLLCEKANSGLHFRSISKTFTSKVTMSNIRDREAGVFVLPRNQNPINCCWALLLSFAWHATCLKRGPIAFRLKPSNFLWKSRLHKTKGQFSAESECQIETKHTWSSYWRQNTYI